MRGQQHGCCLRLIGLMPLALLGLLLGVLPACVDAGGGRPVFSPRVSRSSQKKNVEYESETWSYPTSQTYKLKKLDAYSREKETEKQNADSWWGIENMPSVVQSSIWEIKVRANQ